MAQALPASSASFTSDCALVSRYAAARGHHVETSPELNQQTATSGVPSSSPNALFSHHPQRISHEPSVRPVPEIIMGSSASRASDDNNNEDGNGKPHDTKWPNDSNDRLTTLNNGPDVTETTPLISNGQNGNTIRTSPSEDDSDWWNELKTLSSYTLPVFG